MLKIVMDDMGHGEVAAMYQLGEDAVIMISRHLSDDVRCQAVNDLLANIQAKKLDPPGLAQVLLFSVA